MRRAFLLLGLIASLLTVRADGQSGRRDGRAAEPAGLSKPKAAFDDYRLILNRNIFARDRAAARPRERVPFSQPDYRASDRNPDRSLVLTGVVVRGDQRHAFFEDRQSGETIHAQLGHALGSGKVVAISLDSIDFCSNGGARRIAVGENLTGTAVSFEPSASQPAGAVNGAASRPDGGGDKGADDILERMRKRRLQELGQ